MVTKGNEIELGSRSIKTRFDITRTHKRAHIIIRNDNYTKRSLYTFEGFFLVRQKYVLT